MQVCILKAQKFENTGLSIAILKVALISSVLHQNKLWELTFGIKKN